MYYIFSESSDKNQFNDDDSRHCDHNQEDQECPSILRTLVIEDFMRVKTSNQTLRF